MDAWYRSLPPATTRVPCGGAEHTVGWADGKLVLADHPDAEAEMVLGALGGDKPGCVELAEIWDRRAGDADLLEILPRSADDEITVSWNHVEQTRNMAAGRGRTVRATAVSAAALPGPLFSRAAPPPNAPLRVRQMHAEAQAVRQRQLELMTLLALGQEFQFRLAGGIAATHADDPAVALTVALAGRFAPVAARWLGVHPDDITVSAHRGSGWGTVRAFGDTVWAALPIEWLASVWACGLAVTDGHLVVAATEPGWPVTRVLALPGPGADPVELTVHRQTGGTLDT